MSRVAPYDVAAVFRGAWRSAIARRQLDAGGLVRVSAGEDGILCVVVYAVPDFVIEPAFRELGPGHGVGCFTIRGDAWWQVIHELALAVAYRADPDGIVALFLHPEAYGDAPWRQLDRVAA